MPQAAALAGVSESGPSASDSRAAAPRFSRPITIAIIALAIAIFLALGLLFAPLLGLQTDEVMFAKAWWNPLGTVAWFSVFHHRAPSMLMTYLGALKSWVYAPLLTLLPMSMWLIRVPMIVAAALSILLAGRLVYRVSRYGCDSIAAARFAAVALVCLLALDDTVIVTSVFDWGPVVLQNLLLVTALLLFEKFYRTRRNPLLFWGGLVLGLALWNKALFLWNLSGLVLALFVFGYPVLAKLFSIRRCALLLAGVLLGALPLVRFNLGHRGNTVADNTRLESAALLRVKAIQIPRYLNGLSTQSALVDMDLQAPDRVRRPFADFALWLQARTGRHFSSGMFWGGIAFLIAGLVAARPVQRRWIGFLLLAVAIGWSEALLTRGAGLSIHHAVLFFFEWYCAVALAMAAVFSLRPAWTKTAVALALVLFCGFSLTATTVCYADMLTFEAHLPWTNAESQMVSDLLHSGVKRAIAIDWGISDVVAARSRNRIQVDMQFFPLAGGMFQSAIYLNCTAPDCVILDHAAPRYMSAQAQSVFDASLGKLGLVRTDQKTYSDTHGIATLTSFRVRRAR